MKSAMYYMKTFLSLAAMLVLCGSTYAVESAPAHGIAFRPEKHEGYAIFNLMLKVEDSAKPGMQIYPMCRFVYQDDTYTYGMLSCFTFGIPNGGAGGGPAVPIGPIDLSKVKHIEIVARVGNPMTYFNWEPNNFPPQQLDKSVMESCLKAGGFVIKIPLEPVK